VKRRGAESNLRVLITGVAGLLGSHLADKFLSEGYSVIGADDLSTGSEANLKRFSNNKNFEFNHLDVRFPFINLGKIDGILNFACPASPVHYQADPVRTIETNFLGILNCLHLAHDREIKLLQASTSEVYGDPTVSPQKETYWGNVNPIGIRSCYDEGKRAAETLCFDYRRQYGTDSRVVRIFNTYGPRMAINDGRVVSNFIVQALKGEDITIYGSGMQTRSFCFVDDLVEGIYLTYTSNKVIDFPINLGNPTEFTIKNLAELVIELTGSNSRISSMPLPQDDPVQRKPDISTAKTYLNWEPTIELRDGLERTIEYFKEVI